MANRSKAIGTAFESELVKHLREQGYKAERLALSGAEDEGDVVLTVGDRDFVKTGVATYDLRDSHFILEAKACKALDLAGWVGQAETEGEHYAKKRGLGAVYYAVVHKRRGKGIASAYVTLPLHEYLRQIG